MSLLDIYTQAEPPHLQDDLQVTTLPRLQAAGTEGPTMVWHRSQPDNHYWRWVACVQHKAHSTQHIVLTVTHTPPPEPWIELRPEAVALFKYPT